MDECRSLASSTRRWTTSVMSHPPSLWLPLLLLASGCGASEWNNCRPIPEQMRLCHGVGYTQMRLPNALNQESLAEVQQQTEHWLPLAATGCHADLRILLCSIYAPICIPHLPAGARHQIQPCDSLCLSVRHACLPVMRKFGFAWPEMLNCTRFPPETDLMCIKGATATVAASGQRATPSVPPAVQSSEARCDACPKKVTYEAIIGSYCLSEIALKVRVDRVERAAGGLLRLRFRGRPRPVGPTPPSLQLPTYAEIAPDCRCQLATELLSQRQQQRQQQHYLVVGALLTTSSAAATSSTMRLRLLAVWYNKDQQARQRNPLKRAVRAIRRASGGGNSDLVAGDERRRTLCAAAAAGGSRESPEQRRKRRQRRKRQRRLRQRQRRTGDISGGADERKRATRDPGASGTGKPTGGAKAAGGDGRPNYSYDGYYYVNYNAGRD